MTVLYPSAVESPPRRHAGRLAALKSRRPLILAVVSLLLVTALVITATLAYSRTGAGASREAMRDRWVTQCSAGLQPSVTDTLQRIVGADRRLLALRSYLRVGSTLPERWSWSQEQLAAYPSSAPAKAAAIAIDDVMAAFAAANPGFALEVNRQPRSLEIQIDHWNENSSVGRAAGALGTALERRFTATRTPPSADELRGALIGWSPQGAVALAAPGLSAHGQGHAFDFQVVEHGRVIASTNVESARRQWDAPGWTQKLRAAVNTAGNHFVGPLQSPYEPWHYGYTSALTMSERKPQ